MSVGEVCISVIDMSILASMIIVIVLVLRLLFKRAPGWIRVLLWGIVALIPAFLVSLYFFGLGALIVTATSVAACLFFEWAIGKFLMKKETTTICDGSAVITGVLLAFNLPSNLPIWIIILGALFAIGVGKMSFGGLGNNPFNPALAGRVFLLLSFPVQMTSWPVVGQLTSYTDATTAPEECLRFECAFLQET